MTYRVRLTERAREDLDRLLRSLAVRSLEGAARLANGFDAALGRLEASPLSCGIAYESRLSEEEIRHLLIRVQKRRVYRALFVVRDAEVLILAIRAPGERPVIPEDFDDELT